LQAAVAAAVAEQDIHFQLAKQEPILYLVAAVEVEVV
jgi:hypothetical protein